MITKQNWQINIASTINKRQSRKKDGEEIPEKKQEEHSITFDTFYDDYIEY